jgi:hypothetical protein
MDARSDNERPTNPDTSDRFRISQVACSKTETGTDSRHGAALT